MARLVGKWKRGCESFAVLLTLISLVGLWPMLVAQQITPNGSRKMTRVVKPLYPPLARTLKLSGRVKFVVTVAPDGNVVSSKAVGGHPLLVQSATDAIAKCKWQVAPQQTQETLEINFETARE